MHNDLLSEYVIFIRSHLSRSRHTGCAVGFFGALSIHSRWLTTTPWHETTQTKTAEELVHLKKQPFASVMKYICRKLVFMYSKGKSKIINIIKGTGMHTMKKHFINNLTNQSMIFVKNTWKKVKSPQMAITPPVEPIYVFPFIPDFGPTRLKKSLFGICSIGIKYEIFKKSVNDATRWYRVICSATWWMLRQFALQQVPTLKDVFFNSR